MTNFCGNLAPHDPHAIGVYETHHIAGTADLFGPGRKADQLCPGEPLVEGAAECPLHQAPLAHCRCREERMRRWSE